MADLSRYAWADYLDSMDGLPEPLLLPSAKPKATDKKLPSIAWGLTAAVVVTIAAVWVSELPFAPFTLSGNRHPIEPVMLAIILGMLIANVLPLPKLLQPGLKFATKKLLPLAVILLGARLDFLAIVKVGGVALAMSVMTIALGLGLFLLLIRAGWVPKKLGLLLGIGTAICGGTAIVAAAPVIDAEERDVTFSVATVTLCGLAAMFLMPVLAQLMQLGDHAFGVWAGLAIHQTPQVIAAGFAYSPAAGETATIVKLARVSLLAPVLLLVGWLAMRGESGSRRAGTSVWRVFPLFVFGFLAMAMLKTAGLLPSVSMTFGDPTTPRQVTFSVAALCEAWSRYLIIISMAAVGMETRLSALRQTGPRPLVLGIAAAVLLGAVTLAAVWAS